MKIILLVLSLLVLFPFNFAKPATIIRGIVRTNSGVPVKHAIVNFVSAVDQTNIFTVLTDEHGKYVLQIAESPKSDDSNQNYFMNQNYPNPFSNQTVIEYYIKESVSVKVSVFDILGRKVKTFNDVHSSTKIQWLTWNGTDDNGRYISDGVYFIAIEGEQGIQLKKAILLNNFSSNLTSIISNSQASLLKNSNTVRDFQECYNVLIENSDLTEPKILPKSIKNIVIYNEQIMDFQVHGVIKEFLGLAGKLITRVVYKNPYLYVSANKDGLWRYNLEKKDAWECLGLSDTTLQNDINHGVLDFDVFDNEILVAYNGSKQNLAPDSTVAIWHSTDAGKHWFRSDSGIPESRKYPFEENMISTLQRSPFEPNVILAKYEALYRSTDSGYHWQLIRGQRGVLVNQDFLTWNPYIKGEVWFYGQSSTFEGYLYCLNENGDNLKLSVNFPVKLGLDPDVFLYDVSFEPGNPKIIYVSTSNMKAGIMKSLDGGFTWQFDVFPIPRNMAITKVITHPANSLIRYFINGNYVYLTNDGGQTVKMIEYFSNDRLLHDAVLDEKTDRLFLSTGNGVFLIMVE